jgi:hypothetical protein
LKSTDWVTGTAETDSLAARTNERAFAEQAGSTLIARTRARAGFGARVLGVAEGAASTGVQRVNQSANADRESRKRDQPRCGVAGRQADEGFDGWHALC